MEKERAGAFVVAAGGLLEHRGQGNQIENADIGDILDVASQCGAVGVKVTVSGGMGATEHSMISRRRRAGHAVEKAIDLGAMAWRERPRPGKPGKARITAQGEELLEAMKGRGKSSFVEAMSKTKAGVELVNGLLQMVSRLNGVG